MAARQGLQARSFDLAAVAYSDAVGGAISGDSVARVTEGWGQAVDGHRAAEAERANRPAQTGERPCDRRLAEVDPIVGQANLSTDGTMVRIRGEGWKEARLTAISAVQIKASENPPGEALCAGGVRPAENGAEQAPRRQPSRRDGDLRVHLSRHSYQAGLWDVETMGQHQYAEGLRRGIDHCQRLSSVNDGAPWIERITSTNFPGIPQIVDWPHASGRVWLVANTVFGDQTPEAKQWAEGQLDRLWEGQVADVVLTLEGLNLDQERWPDGVRQAPGYFRSNQERMRYDVFRAQGYPIGSGTAESSAQTMVHHRMRRPGRGWQRGKGHAMLAGLSELHSGRFERAWQATAPQAS